MASRGWVIASAAGVAIVCALSAHAGAFNFGSFMIGNGGSEWVPKCKAPETLTEVKDSAGRIKFVCAAKQGADNKTQAADTKAQAVASETATVEAAAITADSEAVIVDATAIAADSMTAITDVAAVAVGRTLVLAAMTQTSDSNTTIAGAAAPALADGNMQNDMLSASFEKPASTKRQLLPLAMNPHFVVEEDP